MRISDWSSDVCSSDLLRGFFRVRARLYVVPTWLLKCRWIAAMAIFHLSVKVISRAAGRSAVAADAYRSADRLHDERLDRQHDFTNNSGVVTPEVKIGRASCRESVCKTV